MYRVTKQLEGAKTDHKMAEAQNLRTHLLRQIQYWRGTQDAYMPLVAEHRCRADRSDTTGSTTRRQKADTGSPLQVSEEDGKSETITLYLPSDDPRLASEELRTLEYRLRRAQADDALEAVRQQLRSKSALKLFRRRNVYGTGNKPNTRAQDLFTKIGERIDIAKWRYRASRAALKQLRPEVDWDTEVRELKDGDLWGPGVEDEEDVLERKTTVKKTKGTGNGYHEPSWIWLAPGANATATDADSPFRDSVRVQWARAYARVERWDEEFELVCEEMRRVLAFFKWKSKRWLDQSNRRQNVHRRLESGLRAYAARQSAMYLKLASSFARQWFLRLKQLQTVPSWLSEHEDLVKGGNKTDATPDASESVRLLTTTNNEYRSKGVVDEAGEVEDEDDNYDEDEDGYDARAPMASEYFEDDDVN